MGFCPSSVTYQLFDLGNVTESHGAQFPICGMELLSLFCRGVRMVQYGSVCKRHSALCLRTPYKFSMLNKQVTFAMPALEVTRMKVTMPLGLTLYYS